MIFPVVLTLALFCQITSTSYAEPPEPKSTQDTNLPDSKVEAVTTNIFDDYVLTNAGILKIHNSRASWNDARNICLDENAQLAVIDSKTKEAFLFDHMKKNGVGSLWVGVHDLFGTKQWTTITGERLFTRHYVHWANGEPNNAQEHCVELHLNGMNDSPCDVERNFVCEREPIV